MIVLSIPTRNQQEFLFNELLSSVLNGEVAPNLIHLWDNSDDGSLAKYAAEVGAAATNSKLTPGAVDRNNYIGVKMVIEGRKENTTLAKVWNHAIGMSDVDDTIILSNDDIVFMPDTIKLLAASSADFAYPAGARAGNSFSLYKIRKSMWLDVGPFDEQFIPAYFEDNDYHYRMKLKGYDITPVTEAEYIHVGSATRKAMSLQEQALSSMFFRRNEAYYVFKWGGTPYKEQYTVPFNGLDPEAAVKMFNARYRLR